MGSLRVGHSWATSLSLFTFMHWRRKWQPTPVFWPGESQGRGSLVGCRLGSHRVGHDWSDLAAAAAAAALIDTINQGYIHCKHKVSTGASKVKWVTTSICLTIFNNIFLYNLLCPYYYCKIASGRVARSRLPQCSSPSRT